MPLGKVVDLGQKGPSSIQIPCHIAGLLHLDSLWQKISLLLLHIFKGLPSPEEPFMQIICGKACLSVFSVSTHLYIAVLAIWCQTKGPHHLGPKNAFLENDLDGWWRELTLKKNPCLWFQV